MPTPLIPDMAVLQRKLVTLPLVTYQAGETVVSTASTTGRLLILKEGAVAVVKEGVEIARVTEPGAVFGELSVLLDQPHTADVRALEASQFHVADAATILRVDPIALLYVATVLAQRLDSANRGLLELKRQVQAGEPRSVIGQTVEKIEELLGATGANLMYAGYPYDRLHPTHRGAETVALSLGPFPRLAQNEERECAGREARGRRGLGQRKMAITQGKMPFVFGMVVLATWLITAPAAHAACRSPKNICKHLDDCLQRTSDPNNKDTDGIRAGVKARNGQIVLAGAEACARDLGRKQQWDKWARGCSELEFVQIAKVGLELGKVHCDRYSQ